MSDVNFKEMHTVYLKILLNFLKNYNIFRQSDSYSLFYGYAVKLGKSSFISSDVKDKSLWR